MAVNSKKLFSQVLASLIAVVIWESFRFLLNKIIAYNNMEHAGMTNLWFVLFFISVNLLFFLFLIHLDNKKQKDGENNREHLINIKTCITAINKGLLFRIGLNFIFTN